jgi:hypothetical protein
MTDEPSVVSRYLEVDPRYLWTTLIEQTKQFDIAFDVHTVHFVLLTPFTNTYYKAFNGSGIGFDLPTFFLIVLWLSSRLRHA